MKLEDLTPSEVRYAAERGHEEAAAVLQEWAASHP
eukprot:COSAG04_NODE_11289_length_718_cov_1.315024_1_plen_35_part_00